ncbi:MULTISPECIES: DUF2147 domain-containing protein [Rhizobium]|jgi:uncharacterized protein (DUF2147 family)|uniref:Uncharacterized conserved protein, DUF2147 family n=1 Tax=Rhizobium lusitanum TaxID=293958 RepID=A0A1C3XHL0_9HYPH|nr:DUF2147 domain-containing protein [Rhizobium lusitanum]SCB51771.1 Uncharacterized conserved protein, DUF2147 family [Rhizobium lusitanum]
MRRASILIVALLLVAGATSAADALVGNWKTENGEASSITPCGSGYCITIKTGKYAGRKIGTFSEKDDSYRGQLTDPETNKIYSGTLKITGRSLRMQGCVMNVLCKSQTWTRL